MKKDKQQQQNASLKTPSMNVALALDFAEDWRSKMEESKLEKNIKQTLRQIDPARVDLSDEFFDKIHERVMASVTHTDEALSQQKDWNLISGKKSKKTLSKVY